MWPYCDTFLLDYNDFSDEFYSDDDDKVNLKENKHSEETIGSKKLNFSHDVLLHISQVFGMSELGNIWSDFSDSW